MKYDKSQYVGKEIRLYPGDTYSKWGIIENVDDLGWTIRITKSYAQNWAEGKIVFISHSKEFIFNFV